MNPPSRISNYNTKDSIVYIIDGMSSSRKIEVLLQGKKFNIEIEDEDILYLNDTANILTKFLTKLDSSSCLKNKKR